MASNSTIPTIVRYWVDPDICLNQHKCDFEAPDLLKVRSEAGGSKIVSEGPATPEERLQILNAAWVCPVAAFKVEFEDGTVHDSDGKYIRDLCMAHG